LHSFLSGPVLIVSPASATSLYRLVDILWFEAQQLRCCDDLL
jgi:hypothetical protein